MLKVLDNTVMLKEPLVYAVAQTGPDYAVAVKMDAEVAAPYFVKIDQNTRITKPDGGLLEFRLCAAGDLIHVTRLQSLDNTANIAAPDGIPIWPNGDLRPEALVVKATQGNGLPRRAQLAFVSFARNYGKGPKKVVVGKFFDPLTQKEGELPGKGSTQLKFGDPLLVSYAAVPAGTWRHHHNNYRVPADIPYKPTTCIPTKEETFEPLSYRKLSKEELCAYEDVFGRSLNESAAEKGGRIEQLTWILSDRERHLHGDTMQIGLKAESEYEIFLDGAYRPAGTNPSLVDTDRGRAARAMSVDQHIWIGPQARPGGPEPRMILAKVKQSDICREFVRCTLAIPKEQADRLWNETWAELLKRDWSFKCPENIILQKHFRQRLRGKALTSQFARNAERPALQVLRALFGDPTALAKTDHTYDGRIYKNANGQSLTEEQSRAVYASANSDVPLNLVQAPPGAGKSTATTQMLLEQTEDPRACAAGMMPMNKAAESVLEDLAAEMANRPRKVLALQGAMFLSQKSSKDKYHSFRVPAHLQKLAAGDYGQLNPAEKQMVDNALTIASRRFEDLDGMNWGKAIYGSITDDTKDDYNKAVELLIRRYKPQIVLGTTSMLSIWAEQLRSLVTHVVMDEAGKVSMLEATCFLLTWPSTKSLTLIGDTQQLLNYVITAMPQDHRKWGFESLLAKADLHPNAFKTRLSKVFRSHPAIVNVLAQFVYGDLQTDVRPEERALMKTTGLLEDADFPILFIDCEGEHAKNFVNSYTNAEQTEVACKVAHELIKTVPGADVRFFSLYGGARDELNASFKAQRLPYNAIAVDASQGQECDIAVLETAFVPGEDDKTAFLETRERINVAISRAKHGLVIIGSVEALKQAKGCWAELILILMRATRESTSSGRAFVASSVFLEKDDATSPSQGLPLAMMALGHMSPAFRQDLIPEGSKRSAAPVAVLDESFRQSDSKKSRSDTNSSTKLHDPTLESGWIQHIIDAESDDDGLPTRTVLIDESDSDNDVVKETVHRVAQLAADQVEQELAEQLRRFSTTSDNGSEAMEVKDEANADANDNHDMDTDDAFLPPPPAPPSRGSNIVEAVGEERMESPEVEVLLNPDNRLEAARLRRNRMKVHGIKPKKEVVLRGENGSAKLPHTSEKPSLKTSDPTCMKADNDNGQPPTEENGEIMEVEHVAPPSQAPTSPQATTDKSNLPPPPVPPVLQAETGAQDQDSGEDTDDALLRQLGMPKLTVEVEDMTEDDIARLVEETVAQISAQHPPDYEKNESEQRTRRPKKADRNPLEKMPLLDAEPRETTTADEDEQDEAPPILEPQVRQNPAARTVLLKTVKVEPEWHATGATSSLGPIPKKKHRALESKQAKPPNETAEKDINQQELDAPPAPALQVKRPTTKKAAVPKSTKDTAEQQKKPSGSKPRYVDDLFEGSNDNQDTDEKAASAKKASTKPQAKKKQVSDQQTKPKETPAKQPKNWEFPASAKAIQEMLMFGPKPKFSGVLERESWKTAGRKALEAAEKLKAQKKADGLEVSSSDTDEEEDEREERLPTHHRLLFKLKNPEKYKELKEAEDKRAAAAAEALKAKPGDDLQKPEESLIDIIEQQLRAQEPPRRSQRSVSRERSVERKKTLIGPVNPSAPPNLEKPKAKPSAGVFRQPRASLFPNS